MSAAQVTLFRLCGIEDEISIWLRIQIRLHCSGIFCPKIKIKQPKYFIGKPVKIRALVS